MATKRVPDKEQIQNPEIPAKPSTVPTHVTPPPQKQAASGALQEYEIDGATYLLLPEEAERRGAKAVTRPANKAVNPSNK